MSSCNSAGSFAHPSSRRSTCRFTLAITVDHRELADPDRLSALQSQIRNAARRVCREYVIGDLLRTYTLHDCIEATTAQAMNQLEALRAANQAEPTTPRSDQALMHH